PLLSSVVLAHPTSRRPSHGVQPMSDSTILSPDQMAKAAEDAAFGKATGGLLKSFLLGLTAGGYIALGFVFFTTSQVGAAEMPYGVAKVIGGVVFSTGLADRKITRLNSRPVKM